MVGYWLHTCRKKEYIVNHRLKWCACMNNIQCKKFSLCLSYIESDTFFISHILWNWCVSINECQICVNMHMDALHTKNTFQHSQPKMRSCIDLITNRNRQKKKFTHIFHGIRWQLFLNVHAEKRLSRSLVLRSRFPKKVSIENVNIYKIE